MKFLFRFLKTVRNIYARGVFFIQTISQKYFLVINPRIFEVPEGSRSPLDYPDFTIAEEVYGSFALIRAVLVLICCLKHISFFGSLHVLQKTLTVLNF